MKRITSLFLLLCSFPAFAINLQPESRLPSAGFIENKGQFADASGKTADAVLFKSFTRNAEIYLTTEGLQYIFTKKEEEDGEEAALSPWERCLKKNKEAEMIEWCRVEMVLEGASIKKENITAGEVSGQGLLNYYYAHCPQGILGVRTFGKLTIKEVYKGIDWVLYTDAQNRIKYDFIVHPGADANQIALHYKGPVKVRCNQNRNQLSILTSLGDVREGELACFESNGKPVGSHYDVQGNLVKFKLDSYDKTQTLVIDPPIQLLSWSSYYGGTGGEGASRVCTDNAGNVYVTGYCSGVPTLNMGGGSYYQGTIAGFYDAFILKFNNAGVRLWCTYYGGTGDDQSFALGCDAAGNLFVSGYSSSTNLPTQNPGGSAYFQGAPAGGWDAMILQFNNAGVRQWATFYGSSSDEFGYDMAKDNAGNIYIAGLTTSPGFPQKNLAGAYNQGGYGGGSYDAFIIKCQAGGLIPWATCYGGNGFDTGLGVATDAAGNVYLTGATNSPNFPLQNLGGAYNQANTGSIDAYIVKFNNLNARTWATCYGGNLDDRGMSMVTDAAGNLYVGGYTWSYNFPLYNPGNCAFYQGTFGGGNWDAFLLKFNNLGARSWATYYGGTSTDWINSLAVSPASGNLYVGGTTDSPNFPVMNPGNGAYFQGNYAGTNMNPWFGGGDIFYLEFTPTCYRQWATYYGGSGLDWCNDIALDANGCLYATGEWWSSTIPTLNPGGGAYYQNAYAGGEDSYITRFCPTVSIYTASVSQNGATCNNSNGSATASASGGFNPYTYSWSNGQTGANASNLGAGIYTVTITDASCAQITKTVSISQSSSSIAVSTTATNVSCFGYANGNVSTSISGGVSPYTYSWSNGATGTGATGLATGVYTVNVTDANGCTQTATASITQPTALALNMVCFPALCNGSASGGASTSISGGTQPYTYSWSNGATGAGATGLATGVYTVTVTDANGCTVTGSGTVAQPPAIVLQTSSAAATCGQANGTASVSAAGGTGAFSYSWNNGATGTGATGLVTGIYTVTVTDANSCTATATVPVQGQNAANAVFTATDSAGCVPLCITFINQTQGGISYSWDFGDGNTGSGASANHCYNKPGTYSVTLTVTDNNGCISSLTKPNWINVYPNPVADFVVNPQPATLMDPTLHFSDLSVGATGWLWNFGDVNNSSSTLQNPVFTYQDSGCFNVQLIATNTYGCQDTAVKPACIKGYYEIFVPNAFTPDGDGLNDFFIPKGVGISEEGYLLEIFDRWGNLIFESHELYKGWDGRANGGRDIAQMDVYVWKVAAKEYEEGQIHKYVGHVTLVR